jgi:hypothetical protein
MSPKEIKSKIIGNIRYSITHWPENNMYQIHSYNMSLDGDDRAHIELQVAEFYNEKEALEYFDKKIKYGIY